MTSPAAIRLTTTSGRTRITGASWVDGGTKVDGGVEEIDEDRGAELKGLGFDI